MPINEESRTPIGTTTVSNFDGPGPFMAIVRNHLDTPLPPARKYFFSLSCPFKVSVSAVQNSRVEYSRVQYSTVQ